MCVNHVCVCVHMCVRHVHACMRVCEKKGFLSMV